MEALISNICLRVASSFCRFSICFSTVFCRRLLKVGAEKRERKIEGGGGGVRLQG